MTKENENLSVSFLFTKQCLTTRRDIQIFER